ncbi:MAG: hypothetical protein NC432_12335 [Roseburia sp.]|nr:hypothetical protein [Roseburia sp.]MCM1097315.1 hypothetical protein [Ruminococcus flavefaciens]
MERAEEKIFGEGCRGTGFAIGEGGREDFRGRPPVNRVCDWRKSGRKY